MPSKGQACSTPFGIDEILTEDLTAEQKETLLCSTPFGIDEILTDGRLPGIVREENVLNAFRHRRNPHAVASGTLDKTQVCSTPFGIDEILTGVGGIRS